MKILLFTILFAPGFFLAVLNTKEFLCTQFLPTLEISMSLQLVGETSLQGNEKQTSQPSLLAVGGLLSFAILLPMKHLVSQETELPLWRSKTPKIYC